MATGKASAVRHVVGRCDSFDILVPNREGLEEVQVDARDANWENGRMVTALLLLLAGQGSPDSLTLAQALARPRVARAQTVVAGALVAEAQGALRTAGAVPNPTTG
jgi:hypothetical protein